MNQYDKLKKSIDDYIALITHQMRNALWINNVKPQDDYLMGDTSKYHLIGEQEISSHDVQFMQKVVLPEGARLVVLGDLHGDDHALDLIYGQLKKLNVIDDTGKLLQKNCYIACVGDYVNRHPGSIRVVQALCQLFIDNPGRVFLARGNHEYALTNKFFRIRFELAKSRGEDYPADSSFLEELENINQDYKYSDLLYWYDYLPAGLFLGFQTETSGKADYVHICHAGLELGWSAKRLLQEDKATFEWVTSIDRQAFLKSISKKKLYKKYVDELHKVIGLLREQEYGLFADLYDRPNLLDLRQLVSPFHHRFGWQWNNFLAEYNSQPLIAASGIRRNLFFNRELTQYFFDEASSSNARFISVIRGHQHCDDVIEEQQVSSHFLSDIRKNKGMIRQWDGMVYTLGATKSVSHCYSFVLLDQLQNDIVVTHWKREINNAQEWESNSKDSLRS